MLRKSRRYLYGKYFDIRHRVETTASASGPEHRGDLRGYEPSETWQLLRILPPSEVLPTDAFADVGCGKGRVVIAAARHYSFRRVVGVELSADVYRTARRNISRMRPSDTPIELVHSDVEHWEIPPDITVLYLFNPFIGPTFRRFVEKVVTSQREHPRAISIIYVRPLLGDVLAQQGFTLVRSRRNLALYIGGANQWELSKAAEVQTDHDSKGARWTRRYKSAASSRVKFLQMKWDGAGPVGGPG
jgi:predicted RNA methylase